MSASRPRRTRVVLELANRQQNSDRSLVVIKLGGSLLGWPDLIERTEWLLAQRSNDACLLICGGGQAANLVRDWQQVYCLSDEDAHSLAFGAVTFNEALLHAALPDSTIVADTEEMSAARERQQRAILACDAFVRAQEPNSSDRLPHDWNVTSDSIAAWCARHLQADELILAKSVALDATLTVESAVDLGLVDPYFPRAQGELTVSWANLRDENPTLISWL